MKRPCLLTILLPTLLGAGAQSASFNDIVSTITSSNKGLQAERLAATAGRLDSESGNVLSGPSVDFTRVWGAKGIGNKLQLDVAQEFEWPGLYGARRRAARAAEAAAMTAADASEVGLATEVRAQLLELVYVRRQLAALDELRDSFTALREAVDKGVRGGELTVLDQRKMQIETFEIDNQIASLQTRERQIKTSLEAMAATDIDLSGITSYPEQRRLSLTEYLASAENDPAVRAQRLAAASESESRRVARMSALPGFSVGYEHQAEMGDRFNGITVGLKLPTLSTSKARAAAEYRRLAAEQEAENALRARTTAIEAAYAQLESDSQRIDAFNATFGDRQYAKLLLKAYHGGQISVIDYLSEIHYYHQTMMSYLETEYDYHLNLAVLNRRAVL